jgi:hypothetical protein
MSKRLFVLAAAVFPVAALAQVTVVGPFTGDLSEGYETIPQGEFHTSYDVFGGAGTVLQVGTGQGLLVTSGWGFFSTIFPHSGGAFMGGAGVNYEYDFDTPATMFGGYFGTNADTPDATVTFYDANNAQIGDSMTLSAPLGDWAWNGWQYDGGISRVVIIANNQWGGFIMSDDLEYTGAVPEPASLLALAGGLGLHLARRRR